jgi:hypothetical protein
MRHLDVEGLANILKLSECAPEQVDGELSAIEERFLEASLVACSFPFSNFLRRRLSSSSSYLCLRFASGGPLDFVMSQ